MRWNALEHPERGNAPPCAAIIERARTERSLRGRKTTPLPGALRHDLVCG